MKGDVIPSHPSSIWAMHIYVLLYCTFNPFLPLCLRWVCFSQQSEQHFATRSSIQLCEVPVTWFSCFTATRSWWVLTFSAGIIGLFCSNHPICLLWDSRSQGQGTGSGREFMCLLPPRCWLLKGDSTGIRDTFFLVDLISISDALCYRLNSYGYLARLKWTGEGCVLWFSGVMDRLSSVWLLLLCKLHQFQSFAFCGLLGNCWHWSNYVILFFPSYLSLYWPRCRSTSIVVCF